MSQWSLETAAMKHTPTDDGPGGNTPRKGFGIVEWAILAGIAGLLLYSQFFGGGPS